MNYPVGKGMFIWLLSECAGGDPVALALKTRNAGFSWVAIKVQHWTNVYQTDLLAPAIEALKSVDISVWGWGYVVGANSLRQSIAAREATKTIEVVNAYELDGFFIDAEAEYKRSGSATWAATYMNAIRSTMPELSLGLCSYRFPSYHPELPWGTFLAHCNFHAPQVYWEYSHNPQYQMQRSRNELLALKQLPIVPLGSAYAHGDWRPTVADLDAFNGIVQELELPGISWWSWQHAERVPEWWAAITAHQWVEPPPSPPTLEERVSDLEQRVEALENAAQRQIEQVNRRLWWNG